MKRLGLTIALFAVALTGCSKSGKTFRVDIFNPAAQLYDEGMSAYRNGDLASAIRAFSDIVNYYPNNDLADEAMFMLASCYYQERNYVNALAYYKLFVHRYPNHKRYNEAIARIKQIEKILKEDENGSSGNNNNPSGNR